MHNKQIVKGPIDTNKMSRWLGFLLAICLGLVPINKFASGGFQVVDPFMVALIVVAFYLPPLGQPLKKLVLSLLPFIIWSNIINLGYFAFSGTIHNIKLSFNMAYVFFMLYAFTKVFREVFDSGGIFYVYLGLFISLITVFTVRGWYEWEGARFSYSFNNPNQLALYCLLVLLMVILLLQYKIEMNIRNKLYFTFDAMVIVILHYLALQAISRSGLSAIVVADIYLLKKMFSKKLFVPISLSISIGVSLLLLLNPTFIQDRLAARNPDSFGKGAFQSRVESMIIKPMQSFTGIKILIGTGMHYAEKEGFLREMFKEDDFEVHSMFGHVLWAYGIIGLALYLYWVVTAIVKGWILPDTKWVWAAILTYSVGGVVIRFRSYWILLGLILALVILKTSLSKENTFANKPLVDNRTP